MLDIILFYGSYLLFPLFVWCVFLLVRGGAARSFDAPALRPRLLRTTSGKQWFVLAFCVLLALGIWGRFVERHIIVVNEETIVFDSYEGAKEGKEVKIAVIADLHLGMYKGERFLERVVNKLNDLKPDAVLIPGDFIYTVSRERMQTMFHDLRNVHAPIYAVAGNHDSEKPGPYPSDEVRAAVRQHNVQFIDNLPWGMDIEGRTIRLIGLSDIWEGKTNFNVLKNIRPEDNAIVLVHNPDAVKEFPNYDADLVVAGHTHGGQIRIPFLYKFAVPSKFGFDKGWYDEQGMKVFVTSGLGEVGLPMRLFNPPEIVFLHVTVY